MANAQAEKVSVVFVTMTPPIPDPQKLEPREAQRINELLLKASAKLEPCGNNYVKLNWIAFLIDQDQCYPELLSFIERCNMDGIPITIAELAESPVLLSSENHIAAKFLKEKGHQVKHLLRPK